jgi:hypothetical protein
MSVHLYCLSPWSLCTNDDVYCCSEIDQETMASIVIITKWTAVFSYGHRQYIFHRNDMVSLKDKQLQYKQNPSY